MTSGQKTAFSLLITVSLFAALVVASFLGLFSFIDKNIDSAGYEHYESKLS